MKIYLLWSGGTGQECGTLSRQCKWQAKPQISQTTPWRVNPTISDVQWLHFNGELNVRIRNWWVFALGPSWPCIGFCWKKTKINEYIFSWNLLKKGFFSWNQYTTMKSEFFFVKLKNYLLKVRNRRLWWRLGWRMRRWMHATSAADGWRNSALVLKNKTNCCCHCCARSKVSSLFTISRQLKLLYTSV